MSSSARGPVKAIRLAAPTPGTQRLTSAWAAYAFSIRICSVSGAVVGSLAWDAMLVPTRRKLPAAGLVGPAAAHTVPE